MKDGEPLTPTSPSVNTKIPSCTKIHCGAKHRKDPGLIASRNLNLLMRDNGLTGICKCMNRAVPLMYALSVLPKKCETCMRTRYIKNEISTLMCPC